MTVRRRRRTRRVHRQGRKANVRHVRRNPRRRTTRRRRRNPWTVAGQVVPMVANPRRKRARRNRVHHRRRRYAGRRNPFGLSIPPMKSIAFAGVGFIGPSIVSSTLTSLAPSIVQQITGMGLIGKYVLRIGSVLGMSWLVKRFVGVNEGNMVLIGGGVNVALTLVNDFAPSLLPANPLAMYVPTVMPPMMGQAGSGMRQYVPLRGMRAAPPMWTNHPRIPQSAAAFPTAPISHSSVPSAWGGSYGGVPARFKRF
jgi:hypothetical protein